MEYRIEVLASFKKEAKRLRKHYASFIDDYENKAERESITVADVIRRILGQSIQSDKNQLIDQLTSLNVQVKLLINGQQQIIKKLSEFDVDMGNE